MTTTAQVTATEASITTDDGPMPVHVAIPRGTPKGAVVVVQEAFGVTPHIQDVTHRHGSIAQLVDAFCHFGPHPRGRSLPGHPTTCGRHALQQPVGRGHVLPVPPFDNMQHAQYNAHIGRVLLDLCPKGIGGRPEQYLRRLRQISAQLVCHLECRMVHCSTECHVELPLEY